MRRGRKALTGAVVAGAFALSAGLAYGASDAWFSGALSTDLGIASTAAHSIVYVQGSANANGFCVGKVQGFAGIGAWNATTTGGVACAVSGGFAAVTQDGTCCYHGWISNHTGITITVNSATHYDY